MAGHAQLERGRGVGAHQRRAAAAQGHAAGAASIGDGRRGSGGREGNAERSRGPRRDRGRGAARGGEANDDRLGVVDMQRAGGGGAGVVARGERRGERRVAVGQGRRVHVKGVQRSGGGNGGGRKVHAPGSERHAAHSRRRAGGDEDPHGAAEEVGGRVSVHASDCDRGGRGRSGDALSGRPANRVVGGAGRIVHAGDLPVSAV